jgi:uncharacterized protein (DUF1684 family)
MRSTILYILFFLVAGFANAQTPYLNSIKLYQQDYVLSHEVVKGKDREHLHFFKADSNYRVIAKFERVYDAPWFTMNTSGKDKQVHRVYGILHFSIHDTIVKLYVYQGQQLMKVAKYADYLFVPYTDLTSGEESYDNGRYIDLKIADVENGTCLLDFNRAYNPYCAYVSNVYNCPIPPVENALPVAIRAGEMKYDKSH